MSERTILAFKLQSKLNPDQGEIRPVAEFIDENLVELHEGNFCHTNKVLVTSGYELMDDKFKDRQLFRISVKLSEKMSSIVDPFQASKYVCQGSKAEKLKPNELIEIIDGELPDKNNRYFENGLLPSTEYIFIRNKQGECFGPFSWEYKEDDLGISLYLLDDKPLLKKYNLNIGQIFKVKPENFEKYAFSFSVENRPFHFLLDIHGFVSSGGRDYFDYASDEEIVRHCAKLGSDIASRVFNKKNWDTFKHLAGNTPKFSQVDNKSRLARLSELANDLSLFQEDIQENLENFLKGDNGDRFVQDFIERKRPQLMESLRENVIKEKNKEIDEKNEKLTQIESRLKDKEKEFRDVSTKIVEYERKEDNRDLEVETTSKFSEKLQNLNQSISEKENQLSVITERLNLVNKLDDIQDEIRFYERKLDDEKSKQLSLESTTKKLQNEYNQAEDDLRAKLITYKPYVEAINGSFVLNKDEKKDVFVETKQLSSTDILKSQSWVVEAVKHNLSLEGRYFESWQVANLLISTQQSFITFLAGLPGVGKTSLARLIAKTQQLEPRLQEVSVARGWTSQKDLIGFYNPLSNRFQASNSGLYSFIGALGLETKKDEQAMAYVLLDEANLSPIEHYWSAFMAMTDGEGESILRLGQDTLAVPTNLRFLATINYDGTTEPLSPRVVDRAPVLVMETGDTTFEENNSEDQIIPLPLSAIEMNKLFGLKKERPDFQYEEKEIFNKVRDILSHPSLEDGRPLSISPRKEIVIRQYCSQAGALMRSFGCDDFKALDLAILQHVLPQVRGSGNKFANRLNKLKRECDDAGLKDSANYLKRMLDYGETELHSYDFFCW